ncbi:hypothetical protein EXIGLDRAFT_524064 [Exidia glandulosa HHB12029]|uniref:Uncharacterized protein n=1 Tax=Exidia glandulosa HHB12029 TaxID=1314781 RepID=A0A165J101_EXIGL|nr:hypothetical protein EXIGLDRAFT_524064 [Exidia glandulosa HHB12029]
MRVIGTYKSNTHPRAQAGIRQFSTYENSERHRTGTPWFQISLKWQFGGAAAARRCNGATRRSSSSGSAVTAIRFGHTAGFGGRGFGYDSAGSGTLSGRRGTLSGRRDFRCVLSPGTAFGASAAGTWLGSGSVRAFKRCAAFGSGSMRAFKRCAAFGYGFDSGTLSSRRGALSRRRGFRVRGTAGARTAGAFG